MLRVMAASRFRVNMYKKILGCLEPERKKAQTRDKKGVIKRTEEQTEGTSKSRKHVKSIKPHTFTKTHL